MSPSGPLSPESIYRLVADVGFRKHFHLGGLEATRELAELCRIDRETRVLDVGCASGKTACYLARRHGCRVVGVDLIERMVERASERAAREGVAERVSFRVASALELPFEDGRFDVVLGEFITGLLEDKTAALREYLRVTRLGGGVGLNEATWIRSPPPTELAEYLSRTFGIPGDIPSAEGWKRLLATAGLREIVAQVHHAERLSNRKEDLLDLLRSAHRVAYFYATSPTFRRFIREALSVPRTLLDYFGYGIYVGRKQSP